MPTPAIRTTGNAPTADGELNLYMSPEGAAQSWFNATRRIVFVNGMANSPKDHLESAMGLSLLQGCAVVGIYNKTDGFWSDLGQCITDKLTLVDAQSGNYALWQKMVDDAYATAKTKNMGLSKIDFVGGLIDSNAATASVFHYVASLAPKDREQLMIFSHSQGNLVTSNALTAVALALGLPAIKGITVNAFGSPCRYWPAGIVHRNFAFTFDPVSWLDYNVGFSTSKVGFVDGIMAHGFKVYMSHDAEFTVNRFRWGSFRMTASMDEEGLATYLVGIGNNPPRLKRIFQWLDDKHNSDADDVAVLYSAKMRRSHDTTLKAIAQADKSVIQLLIKCMREGVTFSDEKKEIAHLETLI
ncbi:MAG: hypothetical protein ACRBCL_02815 [Maritimibacter sp.]